MKKYSILGDVSAPSDIEELSRTTEAMRRNRLKRYGTPGDVDGYLQFLDERQQIFPVPATKRKLPVGNSSLL